MHLIAMPTPILQNRRAYNLDPRTAFQFPRRVLHPRVRLCIFQREHLRCCLTLDNYDLLLQKRHENSISSSYKRFLCAARGETQTMIQIHTSARAHLLSIVASAIR